MVAHWYLCTPLPLLTSFLLYLHKNSHITTSYPIQWHFLICSYDNTSTTLFIEIANIWEWLFYQYLVQSKLFFMYKFLHKWCYKKDPANHQCNWEGEGHAVEETVERNEESRFIDLLPAFNSWESFRLSYWWLWKCFL